MWKNINKHTRHAFIELLVRIGVPSTITYVDTKTPVSTYILALFQRELRISPF
jgi:hypothetical protein